MTAMECGGYETRTMPDVEWPEFDTWLQDQQWMQWLRCFNEKEAQIGLTPTSWSLVGANPDNGDWAAYNYGSNPDKNVWSTIKAWLGQARNSVSRHGSAWFDLDCKRWQWRDRASISPALTALGAVPDNKDEWLTFMNGLMNIVDEYLRVQEYAGHTHRDYQLRIKRKKTVWRGRYGILPDGVHRDIDRLYSSASSSCGYYTDREGYRYVVSCVDTYGKNAFPGVATSHGTEFEFVNTFPFAGYDLDVLITFIGAFVYPNDLPAGQVRFYESYDREHGGMISFLIDTSDPIAHEDSYLIGNAETCGIQHWHDMPLSGTQARYAGWLIVDECVITYEVGATTPISYFEPLPEFAPGATLTIPLQKNYVNDGVNCSDDAPSEIVLDSNAGNYFEFDVTITLNAYQSCDGAYPCTEIEPASETYLGSGIYSGTALNFGKRSALLDMRFENGMYTIDIDACVDNCQRVHTAEIDE
jgi:hypothetical protein